MAQLFKSRFLKKMPVIFATTIIFLSIYLVDPVTSGMTDPNTVKRNPQPPSQPSKNPTCDDFITQMERELAHMKQKRAQLAASKLSESDYEASMIESIKSLQLGLDGIRHTFVPLSIPGYLRIPDSPPTWVKLSSDAKAKFAKIAADNEFPQREILTRVRRPTLRLSSLEKTAEILAQRQSVVKDENEWRQSVLIGEELSYPMRMAINAPDKAPTSLVKTLEDYIAATESSAPYDCESAVLFLVDVFGDEGPLSAGYKGKCISDEVGTIARALNQVAQTVPVDQCIGAVRPFVADLHLEGVMKTMEPKLEVVRHALEEAVDLIDDVSMADFGSDGPTNVIVMEALKSCHHFQGVERLAAKLQHAAEEALEAMDNNTTEAAKMLAVVMISEKMVWMPGHFALAVGWCSDDMYARFDRKGMFVRAFDFLMNVVPKFD